ncbi:MAG: replication protein, partial [Actinomycetota bacterium]
HLVDELDRIPRAMRGVDPRNPVNRSRGGGVQLELPHRARLGAAAAPVPTVPDRITTALIGFAEGLAATGAA